MFPGSGVRAVPDMGCTAAPRGDVPRRWQRGDGAREPGVDADPLGQDRWFVLVAAGRAVRLVAGDDDVGRGQLLRWSRRADPRLDRVLTWLSSLSG
jgi:hypothetical protein